jgi:hypothetical protein
MSSMEKMILIPVDKYERMIKQRKEAEKPPPPLPPVVAQLQVHPIARPPGLPDTPHPIRRRPSKSAKWIKLH